MRPVANGFLVAVVVLGVAQAAGAEVGYRTITLEVSLIETFARTSGEQFGALTFRGGLELASQDSDFGALSGLDFTPDGSLLAVADTGFWFAARPVERDGRLIGLVDARLAPILDNKGRPVRGKQTGDAEALRVTEDRGRSAAVVAFEGRNDVRRFVAAPHFDTATAGAVRLPSSATGLERNAGLEALAIAPDNGPLSGALVLVAERSLNGDGNHRAWIVGGRRAGEFSIVRSDGYDVTDGAFLPQGDLLVLERRLTWLSGAGMRIRRIAAADLLPGATVDGRVLIEAGIGHQIDNMEGMALRPGADGETLILLVSDDNKSFVQRTLLLQFALPADTVPIPRMRADLLPGHAELPPAR